MHRAVDRLADREPAPALGANPVDHVDGVVDADADPDGLDGEGVDIEADAEHGLDGEGCDRRGGE